MKNRLAKYILAVIIFCLVLVFAFSNINNVGISSASFDSDFPENEYYDFEWIFPPENYESSPFSEGRAWVREKKGGPWTLYDEDRNVIKTGFEADGIRAYEDGVAIFWEEAELNERFHGFVDLSGDILIPLAYYDGIAFYGDGLIRKRGPDGRLYGYVDYKGEWIIHPKFMYPSIFSEGIATYCEKLGGKEGLIDKEGNIITDLIFDSVGTFHNGSAVAKVGSLYGLIDTKGNYIIEPIYTNCIGSRSGSELIAVIKDDKVGFIDRKGNVVIDFVFKQLPRHLPGYYRFRNARALVLMDEPGEKLTPAVIDTVGNIVYRLDEKTNYTDYVGIDYGFIIIRNKEDRRCIFDGNGRTLELPQFLQSKFYISALDNNIFMVRGTKNGETTNGEYGFFRLIPKGGN